MCAKKEMNISFYICGFYNIIYKINIYNIFMYICLTPPNYTNPSYMRFTHNSKYHNFIKRYKLIRKKPTLHINMLWFC